MSSNPPNAPEVKISHITDQTRPSAQEMRILAMAKQTLTQIAKDTQTPSSMRHPLSDQCINNNHAV